MGRKTSDSEPPVKRERRLTPRLAFVCEGRRTYRRCAVRNGIQAALIGVLICARSTIAEAQPELLSPNGLYSQAVNQSARAAELERHGKKQDAIDAYELAGQLSEAALAEAKERGWLTGDRPPEVNFRAATSYLHAGRLLAHLRQEGRRKDEDLRRAVAHLEQVEKIETERAQRANAPINPEVWRVRNAAGYACFLRGELAQARLHYQSVLQMNPTYEPAGQAIAAINKLERQENELFTPQGRTLQKEKTREVVRNLIKALKLARDIVTLGG